MTKRSLDQILVIDVESTCWLDHKPPRGQRAEVIEVGVCCLSVTKGRVSRDSIICRPQHSKVSTYCESLTGHTQEEVDGGILFGAACMTLQTKFMSRSRTWGSWGLFDRFMLDRQCRCDGVEHPMSGNHINIKNLFSLWRGMKEEVGLTDALRIMRWDFAGQQHVGRDDAWNAARVLASILWGGESR